MNCGGEPYVIEYNCRLGDPETEVILPRLQTDLVSLLAAADNGTLEDVNIEYHEGAFCHCDGCEWWLSWSLFKRH